jgi:gliding motility-associated-like protein
MKKNWLLIFVFLILSSVLNGQISADFRSIVSAKSNLALLFEPIIRDTVSCSYLWDFGDGTSASGPSVEHTYSKQGEYLVSLTVTDGISVEFLSREIKLQALFDVTNVFTPNNDGFNDLFVIHTDGLTRYTLTIYSRSGTMVHHSTSVTPVWDGKTPSGEYVHPGVYYYVIRSGDTSGEIEKSGFVHLIREYP